MTRFGLSARALFRDPTSTLVLVVLAVVIGFGIAGIPRFVNQKSDEALATAAGEASTRQRNIAFSQYRRLDSGSEDPFSTVRTAGGVLEETIDGALGRATTPLSTFIDSPMFEARSYPIDPGLRLDRWFTFRAIDPDRGDIRLVAGELPTPIPDVEVVTGPCAEPEDTTGEEAEEEERETEPGCEPVTLPVFQTAITEETSQQFRMGIGDRVLLTAREDTPNNRNVFREGLDYRFLLEVSGIVALSDIDDEFWMGDSLLHFPSRVPVGFSEFDTYAGGILAPDDYQRLLDAVLPSRFLYRWNLAVDFDQIDSSNAGEILADQTRLDLEYAGADAIATPVLFSGIDVIIETYRAERLTTIALTSLLVVGLAGIATGTVFVVAALAARRRQASTLLIRGRGGETGRLNLVRYVEGLFIFVPSVLIGGALAGWAIIGRPSPGYFLWAATSAVILAIVYALMATPTTGGDLGRLMIGAPSRRGRGRRLVIELTLVAVAVGAIILLRRRGLTAETTVDPLFALVPLLISMAVGVLLLRVVPLAARSATSLSGRARGVVGLIGFRSLSRRPIAAQLPPVVALIGITVAVFGVVLTATVSDAQEKGSWQSVGANYRLEPYNASSTISPQLDVADVPGVEATAAAVLHSGGVYEGGVSHGSVPTLAIDLADYQRVGEGTEADPEIPPRMEPDTLTDIGTESNPIPAIASPTWAGNPVRVGRTVTLNVDLRTVVVVIDEVRDFFPGIPAGNEFAIVSREALAATNSRIPVQPNLVYVRGANDATDALSTAIEEQQPGLRLISRPDLLSDIRDRPSVSAVETVAVITYVTAAIFAAIAVVSGFAMTSAERRRNMGYLRAIGLSSRQMSRATIVEQIPPALTAAIMGIATGLGVWALTSGSIDLTPLTGTTIDFGTVVSWPAILGISAALVGTVLVATAIYSYANREMDLAKVLRRGERT